MLSNLLLKLGFRGHDGKARPGNLDENGNLKVKVSGNNLDESDNIKVADSNVSQQIVGLNQSIASLQTQISNLANIIGQTKGHDGSTWRNLKVDSQGRPVLASDVTVNAEGLVVDVGELDITDRPERELGKVQLSGNIVEEEIIPRAIRNTNAGRVAINPPVGAYAAVVEHYIHGVTGTFGAGEGARLEVALMRLAGGIVGPIEVVSTASKTNPSSASGQAIILYPGVNRENQSVLWFGVPPILPIRVDVRISGNFEQGEGFDSQVKIRWLIGR